VLGRLVPAGPRHRRRFIWARSAMSDSAFGYKSTRPKWQNPLSHLHFCLPPSSFASATRWWFVIAPTHQHSIPLAPIIPLSSRYFCPCFYSSSSTPLSPTPHLADNPHRTMVSALLRGSHHRQGVAWCPACSCVASMTIQGAFHWSFASFPCWCHFPPPHRLPWRWAVFFWPSLLGFRVAACRPLSSDCLPIVGELAMVPTLATVARGDCTWCTRWVVP
jgi:hypothetical protein